MRKILFVIFIVFVALGYAETSQFGNISENTLQSGGAESSETKNELVDMLTSSMKKAGIKDDILEDVLEDIRTDNLSNIIDMKSLKSIDSDFSIDLRVDPYARPIDRYKCTLKAAPSWVDLITQSVRMRQPLELKSLKDITYEDFVVYSVLENMKINTSYEEVSPGITVPSHKIKLENPKKWPDQADMLKRFSNLKSKLPDDYTLDMINFEYTIENGWKNRLTIEEWKNKIEDKKFQKQWGQFLKQYKINQ